MFRGLQIQPLAKWEAGAPSAHNGFSGIEKSTVPDNTRMSNLRKRNNREVQITATAEMFSFSAIAACEGEFDAAIQVLSRRGRGISGYVISDRAAPRNGG